MPNKNRCKTIQLAVFSGLFYAGGLALFDYGDQWTSALGNLFLIFCFGGAMGWIAHINLNRPKSKRTPPHLARAFITRAYTLGMRLSVADRFITRLTLAHLCLSQTGLSP